MTPSEESKPLDGEMRRLTPLDIHNKEFSRSFRGYNEDEVDEFLDLVVAEFERLIHNQEELQMELSGLQSRIEHYRGLEETLKNAIVLAQKAADEIKEAALREADAIKRQALLDAQRMREEAQEMARKSYEEVDRARQTLLRFKTEFRSFLESTIEMLETGVSGILERMEQKS